MKLTKNTSIIEKEIIHSKNYINNRSQADQNDFNNYHNVLDKITQHFIDASSNIDKMLEKHDLGYVVHTGKTLKGIDINIVDIKSPNRIVITAHIEINSDINQTMITNDMEYRDKDSRGGICGYAHTRYLPNISNISDDELKESIDKVIIEIIHYIKYV